MLKHTNEHVEMTESNSKNKNDFSIFKVIFYLFVSDYTATGLLTV